jgi:2,4-dienoyl-CoA reductase-like NADH-dependent reductase (Old Yellow Enzyme family)
MNRISLFERYRLGKQNLKNRIVMAPMTRALPSAGKHSVLPDG